MSLVRWRGNNGRYPSLPSLSSMIEDFFKDTNFPANFNTNGISMPPVNVTEEKDAYSIEVAAPGKSKKDFKIEVENGVLCISSEKEESTEEEKDNYTRKEFSYSSFSRSFWLPENVTADDIKANYRNGILNITIPKKEVAKEPSAKTIEIA